MFTKTTTHRRTHDYRENTAPIVQEPGFRKLLNDLEWARLPAQVKARFTERVSAGKQKIYRGHIIHTRINRLGKLLGRLMLGLGGAFPLDANNDGEGALVTVSEANGGIGQIWTRQYDRAGKRPQIIQSRKQFTGPTGLEEFIGHGIGMTLNLVVKENALLFIAERYFVEVFNKRIYLPKRLCPGQLIVTHTDLGGGAFTFGMTLNHPLFGELINQLAWFEDVK